jgi:hypothetical protein
MRSLRVDMLVWSATQTSLETRDVDRRHLENSVATYAHLRGLLMLPLGVLCVIAALANAEVVPTWSVPAALVAGVGICLAIVEYYRRRYGRVTQSARGQQRDLAAIALAAVGVIGASVLLRDLPVNGLAIGFAIGMLAGYAVTPGLRSHQVVVWGTLLLVGSVPVWDGTDSANAGLALAGVTMAICGVLDHREFLHTFGPPAGAGA